MLGKGPQIFVVGTARCGSTLLGRMLGLHRSLACVHELFTVLGDERAFMDRSASGDLLREALTTPDPDALALIELGQESEEMRPTDEVRARFGCRIPRALLAPLPQLFADPLQAYEELQAYLSSMPPARIPLADAIEDFLDWLAVRASKEICMERSGSTGRYLRQVLAVWPAAKVIHIYRDGPACAVSMSRQPYHRILMARRARGDPELSVAQCLQMKLPLDRYGAYWSAVMWSICSALRHRSPDSILHVSYDGLLTAPDEWLERIERQLVTWHVPADARWKRASGGLIRSPRSKAPESKTLMDACRPGRRALEELIR